jgi:nucleotide-binding universal stress UspA family protein
MIRCKCILTGIDLGPDTETIIAYAAHFSGATGASVRLLYVIDFLLTPPSYLAPYIEEERKREESELRQWQTSLKKADVPSDYRITSGRLHESFVTAIKETSPDLLVIGYKSHALRPSSSERLIRSLEMPMLVIRGKKAKDSRMGSIRIRKILCAVDASEYAGKALKAAMMFSAAFDAELQVVHVIPSHHIKSRLADRGQITQEKMEAFDRAMAADAEKAMSRLTEEAGWKGRARLRHGVPAEEIVSLADVDSHDLIVLGARGLSYIKGVLLGSTTDAVLKSSPCPVLIVH